LTKVIPHHTLVQYTATPLAQIFINILDILSPKFIELLEPGTDYVGGKEFFEKHSELIYEIPEAEIYDKDNEFQEPPETLKESMRLFFLCVALGFHNRELIKSKNLSMMVHPSHLTSKHNMYHKWITRIRKSWIRILGEQGNTSDKEEFNSAFENTYKNLEKTNIGLPKFKEIAHHLEFGLTQTEIHELNTKTGITDVIWRNNYSHILVGGQVMDRGFTVEGLIVTYMPRGIGGGNADTIQQRARFFGYKKKYLSFCRVFLGAATKDAYENYLKTEEDLREQIRQHNESGESLDKLRRRVQMSPEYRPTRPNVISGEIKKYRIGDWIDIKAPHDTKDIIEHNRKVIESFRRNLSWKEDTGHKDRTSAQIHYVVSIQIKNLLDDLLKELRFTRESDAYMFPVLIKSINEYMNNNQSGECIVYLMSHGETRERSLTEKDEIEQLFQGRNPKKGKGELIYPGDAEIKDPDRISVQIHKLDLKDHASGKIKFKDVYSIAVWIPEELGHDYQELWK